MVRFLVEGSQPRGTWGRAIAGAAYMTLGPFLPSWVLLYDEVPHDTPAWLPWTFALLVVAVAVATVRAHRQGRPFDAAFGAACAPLRSPSSSPRAASSVRSATTCCCGRRRSAPSTPPSCSPRCCRRPSAPDPRRSCAPADSPPSAQSPGASSVARASSASTTNRRATRRSARCRRICGPTAIAPVWPARCSPSSATRRGRKRADSCCSSPRSIGRSRSRTPRSIASVERSPAPAARTRPSC